MSDSQMVRAWAFAEILKLILNGDADRDSDAFVAEVKRIAQQAAERGA